MTLVRKRDRVKIEFSRAILNRIMLVNAGSIIVCLMIFALDLSIVNRVSIAIVASLTASYLLSLYFHRKALLPLYQWIDELSGIKEQEKEAAMFETTQMLAHDVRKPLAMVKIVLTLMKKGQSLSAKSMEQFYAEVGKSVQKADQLINDVMVLGRNHKLDLSEVGISEIFLEVLRDTFLVHVEGDIRFEFSLDHKHMLAIDRAKVYRVFSNIIQNAIQAMNANGQMRISSTESDGFVTVAIKNSGSYIPIKSIEQLFKPFYTTGKKGGTGLGLAIVKKLVDEHGGKVCCESDEAKNTTTFFVTLPASKTPDTFSCLRGLKHRSSDYRPPSKGQFIPFMLENNLPLNLGVRALVKKRAGKKVKVGLLDDEKTYAIAFEKSIALEKADSEIDFLAFSTIEQTLAAIKHGEIDCLICDIDLGNEEWDGYDVVSWVRGSGYFLPICLHSNRIQDIDYKKCSEVGANSLVPKPMDFSQLSTFICDNLDQKKGLRV